MPDVDCCTSTSPRIRQRRGPCSSCAKRYPQTIAIASSFTIGTVFSPTLDQRIRHLGLKVLKTPVRTPVANAICERVLGTLRRECLDFVIPLSANHLRRLLTRWVQHYNA